MIKTIHLLYMGKMAKKKVSLAKFFINFVKFMKNIQKDPYAIRTIRGTYLLKQELICNKVVNAAD